MGKKSSLMSQLVTSVAELLLTGGVVLAIYFTFTDFSGLD